MYPEERGIKLTQQIQRDVCSAVWRCQCQPWELHIRVSHTLGLPLDLFMIIDNQYRWSHRPVHIWTAYYACRRPS